MIHQGPLLNGKIPPQDDLRTKKKASPREALLNKKRKSKSEGTLFETPPNIPTLRIVPPEGRTPEGPQTARELRGRGRSKSVTGKPICIKLSPRGDARQNLLNFKKSSEPVTEKPISPKFSPRGGDSRHNPLYFGKSDFSADKSLESVTEKPISPKLSPRGDLRHKLPYFEKIDFSAQISIETEEKRKEFDLELITHLKEELSNPNEKLLGKIEKIAKEQFLTLLYEDLRKGKKDSPLQAWQKVVNQSQLFIPIVKRLTRCRQYLVDYVNEKNIETVWANSLLKFLNEFLDIQSLNMKLRNSEEHLSESHPKKTLLHQIILHLEMGCLVENTKELVNYVFDGSENYEKILNVLKSWKIFEDFEDKFVKDKEELQDKLKRIKAEHQWIENCETASPVCHIAREDVIKDTWSNIFRHVFINGKEIDIIAFLFQDPIYSEELRKRLNEVKMGEKVAYFHELIGRQTYKPTRTQVLKSLDDDEIIGSEIRRCIFYGGLLAVEEPKQKAFASKSEVSIEWSDEFFKNEDLQLDFLDFENFEANRFNVLKSLAAISKHELFNKKRKQVLENVIKAKCSSLKEVPKEMNFHMKFIDSLHTKAREQFIKVMQNGDEKEHSRFYFKKLLEILRDHSFDKYEKSEIELLTDILVNCLEPKKLDEYLKDFKDMYKQFFKIKSLLLKKPGKNEQKRPLIDYIFSEIKDDRVRSYDLSRKLQLLVNLTQDVEKLFEGNLTTQVKGKFLERLEPFLKSIGEKETIFDTKTEEEKEKIYDQLRSYLKKQIEKDDEILSILNKLVPYSEKMKKLWGLFRLASLEFGKRGKDYSEQLFGPLYEENRYTIPTKKRNLSVIIQDRNVTVKQNHFCRTYKEGSKEKRKRDACLLSFILSWKAPLVINEDGKQTAALKIPSFRIKTPDVMETTDIINSLLAEKK